MKNNRPPGEMCFVCYYIYVKKQRPAPPVITLADNRSIYAYASIGTAWHTRSIRPQRNLWATAASADLFHLSLVARRSSLVARRS